MKAAGMVNMLDKRTKQRVRIVDSRNKIILPENQNWLEAVSSDAGRQHGAHTPVRVDGRTATVGAGAASGKP